jgi:hypothetical protein
MAFKKSDGLAALVRVATFRLARISAISFSSPCEASLCLGPLDRRHRNASNHLAIAMSTAPRAHFTGLSRYFARNATSYRLSAKAPPDRR